MIVHELQCQRLELRQMLSSLKEKQLQMKFLKEREGWCKNCLNQVKLPALDTFSIQLDDDQTVISQAQGKSLRKWRHRILEMDDWDKIEEQIKFLEIVKDGWQSDDPPFDKHNIYELYALQAQTKDYCLPKKNWRENLRRDRRCNKDYWIDKEKAAYAELNAIKKKLVHS
ncbi:uncharacterized protein LOC112493968 [Cephus cinctus]|uniref:Uncharacterized protein LOC112493968 n=1 Tax=Cephus cinctus TaxID=211228 RepID=A0AAJ7VYT2_CEPCN|nr:uncharacterized protein LOC112493968 [Cephus cinctus]